MPTTDFQTPRRATRHLIRLIRTVGLVLLAFAAIAGDIGPKLGLAPLSLGLIAFVALLVVLWIWDHLPGVYVEKSDPAYLAEGLQLSNTDRQKIENMPPVTVLNRKNLKKKVPTSQRAKTKRPQRVRKLA